MADTKISGLNIATSIAGSDVLPAVSGGDTVQITRDNLIANLTDPTSPQQPATKAYTDAQIAAITNQGAGFTGVITGCGVVWTGNLNFTVSAGTYGINGNTYSVAQTNLTLAAADPTNARFDVIAVNTSGVAVVIQGTPANPALIPTVDPATQLYLTAISVPAGATTPGNVTTTVLYAENAGSPTEWNTSSSGTTWNLASTNNPHLGTKCIEATSLTNNGYAQLQKGSGTFDLSTVNALVFYIRSKAAWNANRSITLQFLNGGTQVGNALSFREGSFGFVSSNTTSYQQILVPISSFNIGNTPVSQLRFVAAGSGGQAIGFYLDDISLQAGASIQNPTFKRMFGASVDGGGSNIVAGFMGYYTVGYSGAITGWSTTAKGTNPTCTYDIWKIATGTAVPTNSNTITGGSGNRPALVTGNALRSTNTTNWTVNFTAGDVFGFNLDTTANATWAQILVEAVS